MMAKSFGEIMRDIGRAFGFSDRASVVERDKAIASNREKFGSQAPNVSLQPRERPTASMISGGDRDRGDRDKPTKPTEPVVETPDTETTETTDEIIVDPITPPKPPKPVNPSDMTSTGASEDLALESANQGLASTILTSGQGIVEEEPGLLRDPRVLGRRRSLTGGGLIQ